MLCWSELATLGMSDLAIDKTGALMMPVRKGKTDAEGRDMLPCRRTSETHGSGERQVLRQVPEPVCAVGRIPAINQKWSHLV